MGTNIQNNYKQINKVLIYVLILNVLVCVLKIVFGYIAKSQSMVADGFHSFTDSASNIVGLIGIYIASRPVDEKHPYGHKKFETLTTIAIGIALLIVSYKIVSEAIVKINNPSMTPEIDIISFAVMIGTTIINIIVSTYETRKGKQLKSDFLVADSQHTRSDIYVSLSVIISLIVVKLGFPLIDVIMSIVIALIIVRAALKILISSSNILCDESRIDPKEIENIVMEFKDVEYCHNIRTRGREDDIHMDLHIWVKSNMTVEEGHILCHGIEDKLKCRFSGVKEVIVHIEPSGEKLC